LPNAAAGSEEEEEEEEDENGIAADARSTFPETGSPLGGSLAGDSADGEDAQKAEGDEEEEEDEEEDLSPLQKRLLMKGGATKKWEGKSPAVLDADATVEAAIEEPKLEQQKGEQPQQQKEEELMVPYERASWEQQDCYDHKVDIWQLGCLMHELLFGCLPFEVSCIGQQQHMKLRFLNPWRIVPFFAAAELPLSGLHASYVHEYTPL
jgi:hypothetical protein